MLIEKRKNEDMIATVQGFKLFVLYNLKKNKVDQAGFQIFLPFSLPLRPSAPQPCTGSKGMHC